MDVGGVDLVQAAVTPTPVTAGIGEPVPRQPVRRQQFIVGHLSREDRRVLSGNGSIRRAGHRQQQHQPDRRMPLHGRYFLFKEGQVGHKVVDFRVGEIVLEGRHGRDLPPANLFQKLLGIGEKALFLVDDLDRVAVFVQDHPLNGGSIGQGEGDRPVAAGPIHEGLGSVADLGAGLQDGLSQIAGGPLPSHIAQVGTETPSPSVDHVTAGAVPLLLEDDLARGGVAGKPLGRGTAIQ